MEEKNIAYYSMEEDLDRDFYNDPDSTTDFRLLGMEYVDSEGYVHIVEETGHCDCWMPADTYIDWRGLCCRCGGGCYFHLEKFKK